MDDGAGKTPLDYLVSMQRPDGHFDWTEEYGGGAFETYSSVRPLGRGRLLDAPRRGSTGASPAVRPGGGRERRDRGPDHARDRPRARARRRAHVPGRRRGRSRPSGAVLADAKAASTPGACVSEFATSSGPGGPASASLDGVPRRSDYGWQGPRRRLGPGAKSDEPIGFGDLVFLKFGATVADPGPAPRSACRRSGR